MSITNRLRTVSKRARRNAERWMSKKRNQRKLIFSIGSAVIVFLALGLVAYHQVATAQREHLNNQIELKQDHLQTTRERLETLKESKLDTEAKLKEKRRLEADLKRENEKLREDLQAKRKREANENRLAQAVTQTASQPASISFKVSGSCGDWMAAAGITDTYHANLLIQKESGCDPNAVNPNSGACGIGQQLPCGKWPHAWNDPVGGMIDMQAYVMDVYGSWAAAWNHSQANNWY